MPELPEVETMRRGIAGIVGARVSGVRRIRCRLQPISITPPMATFRRRVLGQIVESLDRRGKRLLLRLSGHQIIVIEPRMTGLVLLNDPPTQQHLRFQMDLQGVADGSLWYWDRRGLGSVRLLDEQQLEEQLGPGRLGPDALGLEAETIRRRLKHRRTPIKVALLDQKAIAGIGNLYASEILHVAHIHPALSCHRLTIAQWERLAESMGVVLEEAIRYEGSTLSDGTYRTALNNPGGYQNHHRVYDRGGEACRTCRSPIERVVQAQRSTFFCPGCQKR